MAGGGSCDCSGCPLGDLGDGHGCSGGRSGKDIRGCLGSGCSGDGFGKNTRDSFDGDSGGDRGSFSDDTRGDTCGCFFGDGSGKDGSHDKSDSSGSTNNSSDAPGKTGEGDSGDGTRDGSGDNACGCNADAGEVEVGCGDVNNLRCDTGDEGSEDVACNSASVTRGTSFAGTGSWAHVANKAGSCNAGKVTTEPAFGAACNSSCVASEVGCGVSGGNAQWIACGETLGDIGSSALNAHNMDSSGVGKSGEAGVDSSCARGTSLDASRESAFTAHTPGSGGASKSGDDAGNFVSVVTKLGSRNSGNSGCATSGTGDDCAGASSLAPIKTSSDDASNCVCILNGTGSRGTTKSCSLALENSLGESANAGSVGALGCICMSGSSKSVSDCSAHATDSRDSGNPGCIGASSCVSIRTGSGEAPNSVSVTSGSGFNGTGESDCSEVAIGSGDSGNSPCPDASGCVSITAGSSDAPNSVCCISSGTGFGGTSG